MQSLTQSNMNFDQTYPTFGMFEQSKSLLFPEELRDIKVGGLKSRVDVEMSFMKVVFSDVFLNTLYGAGIQNCKLVRYDYKKEKLICRSRLGKAELQLERPKLHFQKILGNIFIFLNPLT